MNSILYCTVLYCTVLYSLLYQEKEAACSEATSNVKEITCVQSIEVSNEHC